MLAPSGAIGSAVAFLCSWKKDGIIAGCSTALTSIKYCLPSQYQDRLHQQDALQHPLKSGGGCRAWTTMSRHQGNCPLVRDAAQNLWPLGTTFGGVFGHWPWTVLALISGFNLCWLWRVAWVLVASQVKMYFPANLRANKASSFAILLVCWCFVRWCQM